ncbi:MAG: hypothetical protein MUF31_14030 [Akkermansiaceae bacterium]|nr:hypothetical protein [Akkermansiaceae bacterium]
MLKLLITMLAFAQSLSAGPVGDALARAVEKITKGEHQGYPMHVFQLDGIECRIVEPRVAAEGNPWLWRARFWGHEPQFEKAMIDAGWHLAYCDVAGLFGNDEALGRWDLFHKFATGLGLADQPFLFGMSRGGLPVMRWASSRPDQVCGIYVDNAVMDIRSWPGGKGTGKGSPEDWQVCLKAYGLTDASAAGFADGPLDRLEPLAKAKVPVLALINEADDVVPPAENGDLLEERYRKLGGPIEVIRRPGLGHHPHSLKDPAPIVSFAHKSWSDRPGR